MEFESSIYCLCYYSTYLLHKIHLQIVIPCVLQNIVQSREEQHVQCKRPIIAQLLNMCPFRPSSRPGSTKGCPGGCALSNCGACYYSYNDLPLPPLPDGCPSLCPLNNNAVNELCMTRWGRCVQRSYFTIYKPVSLKNVINLKLI